MTKRIALVIYVSVDKVYIIKGCEPYYEKLVLLSELKAYSKENMYKNIKECLNLTDDITDYSINISAYSQLGELIQKALPKGKLLYGGRQIKKDRFNSLVENFYDAVCSDAIEFFNEKQKIKIHKYIKNYYQLNEKIEENLLPYLFVFDGGLRVGNPY